MRHLNFSSMTFVSGWSLAWPEARMNWTENIDFRKHVLYLSPNGAAVSKLNLGLDKWEFHFFILCHNISYS